MKQSKKAPRGKRRRATKDGGRVVEVRASEDLTRSNEHGAGIDVGADRHFVAVPPGSTQYPVREFGVFTRDLYAIADWLEACGVTAVAMESTGGYWVPLYDVLEQRGFAV